jgi:hypothetical protein
VNLLKPKEVKIFFKGSSLVWFNLVGLTIELENSDWLFGQKLKDEQPRTLILPAVDPRSNSFEPGTAYDSATKVDLLAKNGCVVPFPFLPLPSPLIVQRNFFQKPLILERTSLKQVEDNSTNPRFSQIMLCLEN